MLRRIRTQGMVSSCNWFYFWIEMRTIRRQRCTSSMLSAEKNMPGKRITTNYNNYVLFLDVRWHVGRSLNSNLSPSVSITIRRTRRRRQWHTYTNDDQWSNNLLRNSSQYFAMYLHYTYKRPKKSVKIMNILKIYIYKHRKDVEQQNFVVPSLKKDSYTHISCICVTMISYFIYLYVN